MSRSIISIVISYMTNIFNFLFKIELLNTRYLKDFVFLIILIQHKKIYYLIVWNYFVLFFIFLSIY